MRHAVALSTKDDFFEGFYSMAVTRSWAQRAAVISPGKDGEALRNFTQELKAYYAALLVFRQPPCNGPGSDNPEWEKCLASYDYVWTYDPPASSRQEILRIATPAATWEKVTL